MVLSLRCMYRSYWPIGGGLGILEHLPCNCLFWKCRSREGTQGFAQGAVFMVHVQVLLVSRRRFGDIRTPTL